MKKHYYQSGSGHTPYFFCTGSAATGAGLAGISLMGLATAIHAIALDLPGYGGSEALPENSFAALADWLHDLIEEEGWARPILVGNSYGGMIVQEYLYRHPGVAACPPSSLPPVPPLAKKMASGKKAFVAAPTQNRWMKG